MDGGPAILTDVAELDVCPVLFNTWGGYMYRSGCDQGVGCHSVTCRSHTRICMRECVICTFATVFSSWDYSCPSAEMRFRLRCGRDVNYKPATPPPQPRSFRSRVTFCCVGDLKAAALVAGGAQTQIQTPTPFFSRFLLHSRSLFTETEEEVPHM